MTGPQDPSANEGRLPLPWVLAAVVVTLLVVLGITQWPGGEEDQTVPTEMATETTIPPTASTTIPPTTGPATSGTSQPSTTETPTTEPPTTERTTLPSGLPERAIAQTGSDIVWVDPTTGETETVFPEMFEASWAGNMSLSPDHSRLYYRLSHEDYWFSCETAIGEVVILDLDSGTTQTIDRGLPALSPSGNRLAYLTAEECYPDPEQPQFFLTAYDTLVVADPDGNETVRFPLAGGDESPAPLANLVWLNDTTLLVSDREGNHYRVPVDVAEATPIREHETVELPEDVFVYAVVEGKGLGARFDPATGPGPLLVLDLGTGEETGLDLDTGGFHAVGVSQEGDILGHALQEGQPVLLVDIDLETATVPSVVAAPQFAGLDW